MEERTSLEFAGRGLRPLPYHTEMRDYLKARESDLWNWFASAQAKADYTGNLRLELLKTTYRLSPGSHAELHAMAEEARRRLQLEIPITIYQAQNTNQLNATLYHIPGEGHLVFSGPVLSLLNSAELKSVLGHELAHYHLWEREGGEYLIADRMLQAMAGDPRAAGSHVQSARWFQLYTEIFCDRGSFCVTGKVDEVVSGLVKIQTGLQQVSASSYLEQAEEIFEKSGVKTAGISHPEAFIRARALSLWAEEHPEANGRIIAMIEGAAELDELDLMGQKRLTALTRRLLEDFLRPKWFQTGAVLGHAKLFFEDFRPAKTEDACLAEELKFSDAKLKEYLAYVLLDFVTADPDLEEMPLAAALEMARRLEIEGVFEKSVTKELKIKARDLKRLKEKAGEMLTNAGAQP